jgi:inorganic triphosphatase YgiF
MQEYEQMYSDFLKNYASGTTTGENVGELVAKLAGYYPFYNGAMAKAERAYALRCRDEVLKTDDLTGKAVSSVKAETLANASSDATLFKEARVHVQNLEMLIQSAKSLQRGLLQEMAHSGL